MIKASNINPLDLFKVFALYGYQKTSMQNIADAAGFSRQGIYKKFKSKDVLFDWMVSTMFEMANTHVLNVLAAEGDVNTKLKTVFDDYAGQFVELTQASPHAAEMLDLVNEASKDNDKYLSLEEILREFLIKNVPLFSQEECENAALTMYLSSKGLMINAANRDDFNQKMDRVIKAVIK